MRQTLCLIALCLACSSAQYSDEQWYQDSEDEWYQYPDEQYSEEQLPQYPEEQSTEVPNKPQDPKKDSYEALVDDINKMNLSWRAKVTLDKKYMKSLKSCSVPSSREHRTIRHDPEDISPDWLPKFFDARKKWTRCPTLSEIRNQGSGCESCWAVSAASVISDRVCIRSEGRVKFHASAEAAMSCVPGVDKCDGDDSYDAFKLWTIHGLVSGGNYNSSEGCLPYSVPPETKSDFHGNECAQKCQSSYPIPYEEDRNFGESYYMVHPSETDMMIEIYKNGPLAAHMAVYMDFAVYIGGVYVHDDAFPTLLGYHAVKLLGWGEEDGKKYWLGANSWGSNWGEKGFFKFLKGEQHCEMETRVMAGQAKLG